MKPSRDINVLLDIMTRLRDPESGCPWDKAQSFESIKLYTIEEAYEVADAIERGDLDDLCDELGDLLLQVVFHARMAEERAAFDFGEVVRAITAKMIRRHPHVFGDEDVATADGVRTNWDAIKRAEKAERAERRASRGLVDAAKGHLDSVPRALPALTEALKLQEKAAQVGFDWSEAPPILDKIEEEIGELRAALAQGDAGAIKDEFGDLLFAVVNLGRHGRLDAEDALRMTNAKFRRRFRHIESALYLIDIPLAEAGLERMEALWQEAKATEKAVGDPVAEDANSVLSQQ